jgi:hypothetical protein
MEQRLADVTRVAPAFSAALRAYRQALLRDEAAIAEGLIAWVSGQPTVAAGVKRVAGIQGAIDHFGATSFLAGLLTILRDSGYAGLVLVLDEVETLQRMRGDTRDKGLNACASGSTRSMPGHVSPAFICWSPERRPSSTAPRGAAAAPAGPAPAHRLCHRPAFR